MLPLNAASQGGGFEEAIKLLVHKATSLFGVDLPAGQESPTFIQNVTQLAKMGFDSLQDAKLFLQLDYCFEFFFLASRESNLKNPYN
jgi:hypothetical protein